jgi:hypothetical protein
MSCSVALAAEQGREAFTAGSAYHRNPYRCSAYASLVAKAADVAWRSAWVRAESRQLRSEALELVLRSKQARVSHMAADKREASVPERDKGVVSKPCNGL